MGLHYFRVCTLTLATWFFALCYLVWWLLYNTWGWSWCVACKLLPKKDRKRIVVVGGGFAGSMISSKLEWDYDVTLIDPRPYTEYTPSILRLLVEESHTENTRIPHAKYLWKAKHCLDEVSEIKFEPNLVTTSSNGAFEFDYLVLCTGCCARTPLTGPKVYHGYTLQSLLLSKQDLAKAKKVLIMGGGTVGVELAAEILDKYPQKAITIAQTGTLLGRCPQAAGEYAAKQLKKRGVTFLTERVVAQSQVGVFRTQSGEEIDADVAYSCIGAAPNADILLSKFKDYCDDAGFARVNDFLQFEGNPNTFVAGDLLSVNEEKLAQASQNAAALVASNIRLRDKGKPLKRYAPLVGGSKARELPVVISLGKYDGIFILQGIFPVSLWEGTVLTGFIPALVKEAVEWKWRFTFP